MDIPMKFHWTGLRQKLLRTSHFMSIWLANISMGIWSDSQESDRKTQIPIGVRQEQVGECKDLGRRKLGGHLLGRKEWANSYPDNQRLKKAVKKPVFVAGQLSGQRVAYNFRPTK